MKTLKDFPKYITTYDGYIGILQSLDFGEFPVYRFPQGERIADDWEIEHGSDVHDDVIKFNDKRNVETFNNYAVITMKIDIAKIKVGRFFIMTTVTKANQCSQYQPNTIVKDGKAYQTLQVKVNWIEDKGEYLYVGYEPCGKDRGACGFGATRIYKAIEKEYGTLGFKAMYDYKE